MQKRNVSLDSDFFIEIENGVEKNVCTDLSQ